MSRLINWIVQSSADPAKLSLTIKGGLVGGFSILGTVLVIFGFNTLPATDVNIFIENAVKTAGALGEAIGALMLAYGALRKIYLTVTSKN
jgi:hypothetical protein